MRWGAVIPDRSIFVREIFMPRNYGGSRSSLDFQANSSITTASLRACGLPPLFLRKLPPRSAKASRRARRSTILARSAEDVLCATNSGSRTQTRVSLAADAQLLVHLAGLVALRHQAKVAPNVAGFGETSVIPDDEHEAQGGERPRLRRSRRAVRPAGSGRRPSFFVIFSIEHVDLLTDRIERHQRRLDEVEGRGVLPGQVAHGRNGQNTRCAGFRSATPRAFEARNAPC